MQPIKLVFPLFLFNQMLAAFLRNDKSPGLATMGVLAGGLFNIFGDYFFVFTCDMGILTVLFNRQIMKYLGTDALAVYGPIINVSTFVQCCAYSGGTGGAAYHLHQFRSGEGGPDSIWLAMPITELVILLYALTTMKRMTKALAQ